MKSTFYKNLLYPTDFSDQSVHLLGQLLQNDEFKGADLYILHAFRLLGGHSDSSNLVEAKRMLETNSVKAFDKLSRELFENINQPHHFLSDVGFVSDRIKSNIKEHNIDLLVLSNGIRHNLLEKEGIASNGFLDTLSCDILLLPEEQIIVKSHGLE